MKWQDHISVAPHICHGKPCIKSSRVMVSVILSNLADGETFEQVACGYHVAVEDVKACLDYAAELASERVVDVPAETP